MTTTHAVLSTEPVRAAVSLLVSEFGKPHAAFVASGMAAVETALYLVHVERGDRVLVPVECCYTVGAAILRAGGHPVFVDTGRRLVASAADYEAALSLEPRAVIAVHTFGLPCDVAALRRQLPAHIPIIEDASLAFGVSQPRSRIGDSADVVIVSMGEAKPISLGEGGVVLTDADVSGSLDRRSSHSRERSEPPLPFPLSPHALTALPAALNRARERLAARREVAARLNAGLQALGFETVDLDAGSLPGWHRIPVWGDDALRRAAIAANAAAGETIAQLPHAVDVPDLTMFKGRSTRIGRDRRDTGRMLLVRSEPAESVLRWYDAVHGGMTHG